jgi:hypothetical protein
MNGYLNKRGDRIGKIDLISNPLNTKLIIIKKAQVDITGSDVSAEDVNEHKELETVKPCFMLASSSNGVNLTMGSRVDKNGRRSKGSQSILTCMQIESVWSNKDKYTPLSCLCGKGMEDMGRPRMGGHKGCYFVEVDPGFVSERFRIRVLCNIVVPGGRCLRTDGSTSGIAPGPARDLLYGADSAVHLAELLTSQYKQKYKIQCTHCHPLVLKAAALFWGPLGEQRGNVGGRTLEDRLLEVSIIACFQTVLNEKVDESCFFCQVPVGRG